ncbi:MAG TPA: class I SAM-dependent methyltransferase, partial [Candidatus Eremiobacteraceae bacterium]|nr:class I SAM-dependent methyltransferase [Candidatus Eremiobacteraceae bacterium]
WASSTRRRRNPGPRRLVSRSAAKRSRSSTDGTRFVLTGASIEARIACPLCRGRSARSFKKLGYWIRACTACEHHFVETETADPRAHAQATFGDDYFFGGDGGYEDYLANGAALRAQGRAYGRLLARHRVAGDVLDVGAAAGYILAGLRDEGWHGSGIEPNATMAGYARSTLGLRVRAGVVETIDGEERFDAVVMAHVLASCIDPVSVLHTVSRVTREGGLLLVESRLRDGLAAWLLGKAWLGYNPPAVLHWFTAESVAHTAGRCGYQLVAHGRPRKRIAGSRAKTARALAEATSGAQRALAPLMSAMPDTAKLPFPAGDLAWMLFRKA